MFLAVACGGKLLLYLGSLFETLDYTLPPGRDEAKLDALAWHILDRHPKTLLGLAIRASAENFGIRRSARLESLLGDEKNNEDA